MKKIVFYFQMHQPRRLAPFSFFDTKSGKSYFNDQLNRSILHRVVDNCYLPSLRMFLKLSKRYPSFALTLSISGVLLEQLAKDHPLVLDLIRELLSLQKLELCAETYYHSLSFLRSPQQFQKQVEKHLQILHHLFQYTPRSFRNTELIFANEIITMLSSFNFTTFLIEGAHLHHPEGPNFLFTSAGKKILARNYPLSDDIAFRFSQKKCKLYPLTVDKYLPRLMNVWGDIVNIYFDLETFGEHHADNIFLFFENLIDRLSDQAILTTPQRIEGKGIALDIPSYTSWADKNKDLSAWISNDMQRDALDRLFALEEKGKEIEDWNYLTTSDHFYYMSTKDLADGAIHNYFNPHATPFEAYIIYCNILHDLAMK